MKRSINKKETEEDKFIRKYYSENSALRYIKTKKRENNRKIRRNYKQELLVDIGDPE